MHITVLCLPSLVLAILTAINLAEQGEVISAFINTTLLFDRSISLVNNGKYELNMNRDPAMEVQ